ncbi:MULTISPECIES: hypothetical protein [unclassified Caballeronia]|uniref:hypothetical protein n=1 Tax=unclassified Caballeronia TaxID=2646786 RepID=UPI001F26F462|nr:MULTISPECIES: hypothetical protein [unclassified Caballeronia]MCE4545784.1 hypothetical protein [Caballeronia sp. PC1]MCE4572094.1 hypothetical protein [Caballeronia sp. CLC5]
MSGNKLKGSQQAIARWVFVAFAACSSAAMASATSQIGDGNNTMSSNASSNNSANQTGIPDGRINWMKNPLITRIGFIDAKVRQNSIKLRYSLSLENPTASEVKGTGKSTPDEDPIRLYSEGNKIDLRAPRNSGGLMASKVPPRDDEIKQYRFVMKGRETWTGDIPAQFSIESSQLLPGTHIYEIVYWQNQLDWIDVREMLQRSDAQGPGRMVYPLTDNAPSNRLYFKVYKPTEEEAAKGHQIEFLGEVDAKTQVPALPYARPGDYSPKTGYWQAVGETIDKIGGYHEVFVKEGNSMPNLPGKVGVDPFSFRWKYVGEQSMASGRQSN